MLQRWTLAKVGSELTQEAQSGLQIFISSQIVVNWLILRDEHPRKSNHGSRFRSNPAILPS